MIDTSKLTRFQMTAAQEIAALDPGPKIAPFAGTQWVASSLLQKAIRRGGLYAARQAGRFLLEAKREHLLRRLNIIAAEDIGMGDIETVAITAACLASAKIRRDLGGDAVVTGSNGAAVVNDDRGRDPLPMQALLTAPYSALGFEFDAFFIFDQSQRLTFVDLSPRSPGQCNEIRFSLLNSYGEPDQRGSFGLLKWWHSDSGNVVVYSEIAECQIRYMEFSEPGQQGGL